MNIKMPKSFIFFTYLNKKKVT